MEIQIQFHEIIELIQKARQKAFANVNKELINLYWDVGEYISSKVSTGNWGDSVVKQLAEFIEKTEPETKGFNERGLWRMKQFYETYKDYEKLSPLVTELTWTNNLMILTKTKSIEEKEFYLKLSIKENYSKRELERQINSCVFERYLLSNEKLSALRTLKNKSEIEIMSPLVTEFEKQKNEILSPLISEFKDTYIFEFLNLPELFSEKDLQKGLVANLKKFLLELGRDFTFISENFRVQVGNNDYYIDLLFYHRGLSCLVAFELKIDEFQPEYIGKINFYLEALDKDVKKPHENPSVGVILCKTKDSEVVEYALSRSLSPAMIAEYKTKLIDKSILLKKLKDISFDLED